MSETRIMLDRMPLQYRARIEQEVSHVWEMKRAAEESNAVLRARVAELDRIANEAVEMNHKQALRFSACEAERDRYQEALEIIAKPLSLDGPDPDDIAKEVLRVKAPALGCLKCSPGDDCPEDCLDRNYRVTDN